MALELKERIHSVPRWGWWVVGGVTVFAFVSARKAKARKAAAAAAAEAEARAAAQSQEGGGPPPAQWAGGAVGGMHNWTSSPVGPPEQLPPMPPNTPPFSGASRIDESFFGTGGPALSGGQHYMDTFFPQNSPPPLGGTGMPRPGPHHRRHHKQHERYVAPPVTDSVGV